MNIEVSVGEAIDKLSILEIKLAKITDEQKRTERNRGTIRMFAVQINLRILL
jgi:hypothetical protein